MNETNVTCMMCQKPQVLPVSEDEIRKWKLSGRFAQDFFFDLTPSQRELLISGTCGACFDDMFKEEPCNQLCVTSTDLGLPEYGDMVAYPHPDCPEHSDG